MEQNPTILIVDVLTDEVVERELTSDEQESLVDLHETTLAYQASQDAKQDAHESALAKLTALGLTQEEIEAL